MPVNTRDSCLACTLNSSHASFTVPSLKYFQDIFSHAAAVRMWVRPFLGSCFKQVALGTGSTVFLTLSLFSSSVVFAFLSSTGFKNPSRMLSCTNGWTAPLITDIRVVLSVIFVRVATFAHTFKRCPCACAAWLNMSTMNAVSLARLARSGSYLRNSWPDGISSGGVHHLDAPSHQMLPQV